MPQALDGYNDADPVSRPAREFVLGYSDRPLLRCELEVRSENSDRAWLIGPSLAVTLNETACEILMRCRGRYSVRQIVEELQILFVGATAEEIDASVLEFLELALDRHWVERA